MRWGGLAYWIALIGFMAGVGTGQIPAWISVIAFFVLGVFAAKEANSHWPRVQRVYRRQETSLSPHRIWLGGPIVSAEDLSLLNRESPSKYVH